MGLFAPYDFWSVPMHYIIQYKTPDGKTYREIKFERTGYARDKNIIELDDGTVVFAAGAKAYFIPEDDTHPIDFFEKKGYNFHDRPVAIDNNNIAFMATVLPEDRSVPVYGVLIVLNRGR